MNNSSKTPSLIAGRYQVIETHEGGMGQVHFCLDTQDEYLGIALKTIKPEFLPNIEVRDRFLREATIWIQLGFHPNLVQAYKVLHIAEDQSVYIIMQLIPSLPGLPDPSLRSHLLVNSPFGIKKSLEILFGIILGMKQATQIVPALVHRDLKPENILIGSDNQPKITDFGLASIRPIVIEGNSLKGLYSSQRQTLTKGAMGTPLYMSPEQWVGEKVDQRSDIYSVGCIFFEMLTGEFAVVGEDPEELYKLHSSGMARENVIKANIKPNLKTILIKCLEPNLENRFKNWEEFRKEVKQIGTEEGCENLASIEIAMDVSRLNQFQKSESLLAIGAANINIGNFSDSMDYFYEANNIATEQGFPTLHALSMANLGIAFSNQGYFEEGISHYQAAIAIFEQLGESRQVSYHTGNMGNAFLGLNDFNNALHYLELARHQAEINDDLPHQAVIIGNLGNVYKSMGNSEKAMELFQKAFRISKNSKDKSSAIKHLASIALILEEIGDIKQSLEYLQLSLKESQQIGDRQSEGNILLSIGDILSKEKRFEEGICYLTLALEIGNEMNDLGLIAKTCGNIGVSYNLSNQTHKAIPFLNEAIKYSKMINAKDIYARASWSIGVIAEIEGDFSEAILHLRTAVATFKELNMPEYQQANDHLLDLRKQLGLL
ncbi:MAG: protein kinase [Anaerolineaceae bacterium]